MFTNQYIYDLSIIKRYDTPLEAVKEHGFGAYDLLIHGEGCKTANNYFFIYENEYKQNINNYILNKIQPICKLDKNGKLFRLLLFLSKSRRNS